MLVPPRDPLALAAALGDLYALWGEHRNNGFGLEKAQVRLRNDYSMDGTEKAYLDVYKKIVPDLV